MAQIQDAPQFSRRKAGIQPVKKHQLKTDMTPMVDLGFLLIAFFVMTTELSKPHNLKLNMPRSGPEMPVPNSVALTVLLTGTTRVFFYHGEWKEAQQNGEVYQTTLNAYNGIGKVIREKQEYLNKTRDTKEGANGLMLIIKPGEKTRYAQIVDMLDETIIHKISRHVMVSPDEEEMAFIKTKQSLSN